MKTLFLLVLLLNLQSFAQAQAMDPRVATMVSNCRLPMGTETCALENTDKATCATDANPLQCRRALFNRRYPNGKLYPLAGRFTADEVFVFVDADKRMCDQIITECHADASAWDSRTCKLARVSWQAYSSNPPGQGIGGTGK